MANSENESDYNSDKSEQELSIEKPKGKKKDGKAKEEKDPKPKRGKTEKTKDISDAEEDSETEVVPAKKGRSTKEKSNEKVPPKNKTSTSYEAVNFTSCESHNGKEWNFKISNWNVDGIRAWLKKGKTNIFIC